MDRYEKWHSIEEIITIWLTWISFVICVISGIGYLIAPDKVPAFVPVISALLFVVGIIMYSFLAFAMDNTMVRRK